MISCNKMESLDCVRWREGQKKPSFFSCLGRRDIPREKYKHGRGAMGGFGARCTISHLKGQLL